jgi:hypothetical protein
MLQKDMIPPLKGANYVGHEDGGSKFFRNFGTYRQYYGESYIDMCVCVCVCVYIYIYIYIYIYTWRNSSTRAYETSFLRFLRHTQLDTHTHTHTYTYTYTTHTHSRARPVTLLWVSDQTVTQAATYTAHTKHRKGSSMTSACFERAITTITRSLAYGLDRVAMICRE